jgi:ribonuclease HI
MIPISSMVRHSRGPFAVSDAPEVEFLLVCQAQSRGLDCGTWSFALETADGDSVLQAQDMETGDLNRLSLLAAVRGLESIDGPSSVLMLSNNRYLIRSLSDGLPRWRESGFQWEHFGRRIDVQHADLWRRVDRAVGIHCVQACLISSRLVSRGRFGSSSMVENRRASSWNRFDSAEPRKRPMARRESDRDGLRRWLFDDVAKHVDSRVSDRCPRPRFLDAT